MKTKKALAVVLAVVMLVMPLAVSSFAATENGIVAGPVKTAYTDNEFFNPQGLSITYNGEVITYVPTDASFRFEPALNELLFYRNRHSFYVLHKLVRRFEYFRIYPLQNILRV